MNKFKDIFNADEINTLIKEKAYTHTQYYHYSDLGGINSILDTQKIWVSSMCYSNDATEHDRFGDDTYRYFQLCFSTGTTENLPLWFLYSGTNGKGARISLSKKSIEKLIDFPCMKMKLVNIHSGEITTLIAEDNCSIEFKDVIYRKKEAEKYRLKYNTQVNNSFSTNEMIKVESENKAFIKDIIWFYEKETRLLIKVDESLIDKKLFKNAVKPPYRIELSIPDECYKDIDVMLSPAYEDGNETEIKDFLIKEGFLKLNKAKLMSEYAGQIKIDLCKKCNKCENCDKCKNCKRAKEEK